MKRHSLLLTLALALATSYALAQTGGQAGQYPSSQSPSTQQAPTTQQEPGTQPAPSTTAPDQGQGTAAGQTQSMPAAAAPDNDALAQQVQQKLATEPALRNVQAEAKKGVVTLTGTVASKADRKHAEELAKSVPGVHKVHSKLKVDRNAAPTTSGAAETPAPSNAGSEAGNMSAQAGVQQGNQEPGPMTGATPRQGGENPSSQANAAQTQQSPASTETEPGQAQPGMTQQGVQSPAPNNQMGTMQSSTQIQSEIQNALAQQSTLNGSNIQVNVTDTNVELTGTVATPDQKQAAERIAGSYAGSRRVVNHITVTSLSGQTGGAAPGTPAATQPQTMPGQGNVNPQTPPRQTAPPQQQQNPPMSETPPPQPQPQPQPQL
jgi:osmotically-inducible protein OsmY